MIFVSDKQATTTRKIGKITYLVTGAPSEKATDALKAKLEKLIIRDSKNNGEQPGIFAKNQ